jgi:inosose dehydratase
MYKSNKHCTRREFMAAASVTLAGAAIASSAPRRKDEIAMNIGFHTDAFNSSYWNFEKCLQWAQANDVHYIECGVIDGVSWIHGLGYQPHVALYEDPLLLRRKMEKYGVRFSQVDAAFPLSGKDGPLYGVPYVLKTIPWAKLAGCERIATTDGLHKPAGLSDDEAMESMKRSYGQIIEVAEAYEMTISIEVHGYFTTRPDMMARMLAFCDSAYLRMNIRAIRTLPDKTPWLFVSGLRRRSRMYMSRTLVNR